MNNKVDTALQRLNDILPLKEHQDTCAPEIKNLHQQILQAFITRGQVLSRQEMARNVSDVSEALQVLSKNDMVTISENGELTGAYPFSIVEREHTVQMNGHVLYAMCALDTLAIAPMFQLATKVISKCVLTGEQVVIQLLGEKILNLDEVSDVYFGITWSAMDADACCADSLCREMVFLRDNGSVQQWLANTSSDREVFTLPEAVQFASRFFVPLLS